MESTRSLRAEARFKALMRWVQTDPPLPEDSMAKHHIKSNKKKKIKKPKKSKGKK